MVSVSDRPTSAAGFDLPGLRILPGWLEPGRQSAIVDAIVEVLAAAPLYQARMPRSGRPLSVRMTNCGELGWYSDRAGYRYEPRHPVTGERWPPIPVRLLDLWDEVARYPARPQACLVNFYTMRARMGLHRDEDEEDLAAPVVSVSLGDDCRFRIGGLSRSDPTRSVRLRSGDVVVLGGDARLAFHGVERIYAGTSGLLARLGDGFAAGGRLNLTLRRVGALAS
jgi:alkylated DNA repair protein (DNA oxidative demethylase)